MRRPTRLASVATVAASAGISIALLGPLSPSALGGDRDRAPHARDHVTFDDLVEWTQTFGNQERFEKNIGLGAANLITPAGRRRAANLVERGISVSLAHNIPQTPAEDPTYLLRTVLNPGGFPFISDRYEYQGTYHGATHSHLDALGCHVHNPLTGRGWNNAPAEVTQENGCSAEQGGIIAVKDGVFTRGILIDLPRFKGKEWLDVGEGATYSDLVAYERWANVRIRPGDAVFLYNGRWKREAAVGPYVGGYAGWHASVIPFLRERGVSYIGNDAINDVLPHGVEGNTAFVLPVHQIVMPILGINIFDNLDLEALAETAKGLGRYDFLLTASPLRIDRGLGSPANPIATF